jgi:hypothetical protein
MYEEHPIQPMVQQPEFEHWPPMALTALMGASRHSYCSLADGSVFEEQVANLLPQHNFESAKFNN